MKKIPVQPYPAVVGRFDDQDDAVVHCDRERLCAGHAAQAGGEHEFPAQRIGVEIHPRAGGERFVRSLKNSLRADVDP